MIGVVTTSFFVIQSHFRANSVLKAQVLTDCAAPTRVSRVAFFIPSPITTRSAEVWPR